MEQVFSQTETQYELARNPVQIRCALPLKKSDTNSTIVSDY